MADFFLSLSWLLGAAIWMAKEGHPTDMSRDFVCFYLDVTAEVRYNLKNLGTESRKLFKKRVIGGQGRKNHNNHNKMRQKLQNRVQNRLKP